MSPPQIPVLCFPFAGAGASFFRPWQDRPSDVLLIRPVQLPGREKLFEQEPYRDVKLAIAGMLPDLLEAGQSEHGQVALFGHSLGAALAYEAARQLRRVAGSRVRCLFASGSPAPWRVRTRRAATLSDEEFLARVRELAGYTHPALEDPGMREILLPVLRADVEMHESYRPTQAEPLDIPIISIRGDHDDLVSAEHAAEWSAVTCAESSAAQLPGGHMYLTEGDAVLRLMEQALRENPSRPSQQVMADMRPACE